MAGPSRHAEDVVGIGWVGFIAQDGAEGGGAVGPAYEEGCLGCCWWRHFNVVVVAALLCAVLRDGWGCWLMYLGLLPAACLG